MKKYIILIVSTISIIFTGCAENKHLEEFMQSLKLENRKAATASVNHAVVTDTEQLTLPIKTEEINLHQYYQTIIKQTTEETNQGYILNEAFLNWFTEEYGTDRIKEIADCIETGKQSPDFWYEQTGNTMHVLWMNYCKATGIQPYRLENAEWKDCASEDEVTLAFTGDINFSEGYVTTKHLDRAENGIQDCFSEDLLTVMNTMDIMMINNEFTYSTRGKALAGKAYTFRADPSRVELLETFGTDIVSLANNHVYDFGPEALLDTISTLNEAGIPNIGAGANLKEASKPYYFICNGRKIAIVAATQIERSLNYTKEATADSPGVLKALKPDKFVEVIKNAKKDSDIVIAFVHWGTEGDSNYGRDQNELAKAFVEAGADAIIGGHTHCLQGFEIMDGVPIIYSLGNFWFSSKTQDTGLAKLTIDDKGELTLSFIPCIQQNFCTYLVTEEVEKKRILDFMQEHSAPEILVTPEGEVYCNDESIE
ncbi:MAG: CapA family protein [Lachnospiraceae bacterium]|nr:CapA family protein [Lachnospiraceae bacterium]